MVFSMARPATVQPDGSVAFNAAYTDGWPLTTGELPRFEAQASTNLATWVSLSGVLSISNGSLVLVDPGYTNSPTQFYRVIEHQ
jgi:hypothetical protein